MSLLPTPAAWGAPRAGNRLAGIELLRFLAAIAVVLWYYRMFGAPPLSPSFRAADQPFFDLLARSTSKVTQASNCSGPSAAPSSSIAIWIP
ncbi:MAG: hypothetical protein AAGK00_07730 [Pseudomonadota bacterium]